MFIDGFMGLLSSVGGGGFVEWPFAGGYNRQPISFSSPVFGLSRNSRAFSFGNPLGGVGIIAGRGVFNAPTMGEPLLILPLPAPAPVLGTGPTDAADVGEIQLLFSALVGLAMADAYTAAIAQGTVLGTCWDRNGVIGTYSTPNGAPAGSTVIALPGPQYVFVNGGAFSAGTPLTIRRGVLDVVS